ncbi:MAG: transcription repressor NadR [Atopobiaceae bacterium]|nr:transcription repressor NadR [Atopobiaceae bacterium]
MKGHERRFEILALLEGSTEAIPGAEIARRCGVSRQVIVHDIALLRREGNDIVSTHGGYVLARSGGPCRRLFKVCHDEDRVQEELFAIIDLGGTVEDVIVNHRVFGKIDAKLDLSSRREAQRFLDDLLSSKSTLLCKVTSGYHFHHVSADSEEVLDEIEEELVRLGFLAELRPYESDEELSR